MNNYSVNLQNYIKLHGEFADAIENFGNESDEADNLRDLLDEPWHLLTDEELDAIDKNVYPELNASNDRITKIYEKANDNNLNRIRELLMVNPIKDYSVKSVNFTDWYIVEIVYSNKEMAKDIIALSKVVYRYFTYNLVLEE